ncbi:chemotaxis protein CheW [Candidatus Symbiobacter mobilis]|uniref:Chemotaxis protein CheW n=1 Tax=Candidatus Symbiobacter mobilis CR TaxID=946483 RepID=U5N926_9BURK|nr:chemotaxis protein CheW [Candidatus Symbiobacter mobilis]AGX87872.1 chemotaxis protein CheW [Candidatus Symbiobacter mobilis CR]
MTQQLPIKPASQTGTPVVTKEQAEQYLTFSLGDEVFAIDIRSVREIIQHSAMTVVPLMPAFVRGVINLRGAVVPVIDLQARFGRQRAQVGKKTCVIIFDVGMDKVELGLLVDAVSEVIDIPPAHIEPAPQFGTTISREFIHGLGKIGKEFIVILEPDKALNIEDMATLAEKHQGIRSLSIAKVA